MEHHLKKNPLRTSYPISLLYSKSLWTHRLYLLSSTYLFTFHLKSVAISFSPHCFTVSLKLLLWKSSIWLMIANALFSLTCQLTEFITQPWILLWPSFLYLSVCSCSVYWFFCISLTSGARHCKPGIWVLILNLIIKQINIITSTISQRRYLDFEVLLYFISCTFHRNPAN